MGIRFVLLVNKQGQTRLAQYYEHLSLDERRALEGEIVRKCLARTDQQVLLPLPPAESSTCSSPPSSFPGSKNPGFVLNPNQERRSCGSGSGWAVVDLDFHARLTGTLCQCSALSWSTGTTRSSTGATPLSSSSSASTTMRCGFRQHFCIPSS
uniref:AP complex mu/sigma subunit domain-containing protein n=1 Tax=Aegilops tauschii subsp. strangulata TaxID=200361 RepID=A0A453N9Y2_AEGTS